MSKQIQPLTYGVKPCITKTGVMIGVDYVPPRMNTASHEEEFWQDVLLGIEPEWSRRRIARWVAYAVFLGVIFSAAILKGKEAMQ